MNEYGDNSPQRQPVEIDLDKVRQQLPELAREFATLVMQELRMGMAASAQKADGDSKEDDHLSPENIDKIMGNAGIENLLTNISGSVDDLKAIVQQIPAAIQNAQMGGGA